MPPLSAAPSPTGPQPISPAGRRQARFQIVGLGLIATRELKKGTQTLLESSRSMPRGARIAPGEIVYQALTRANERNELSHKPEDYSAFERIIIWPLDAPADWIDQVNGGQTAGELDVLRKSVNRGTPYGSEHWTMGIANMLGLEFAIHFTR